MISDQSEDYNRTKNFGISTGVVNISLFGASIRQLRDRTKVTTNYFALGLYLCIHFFFWAAYGGIIPYLTSFLADSQIMSETMSPIWVGGLTLLSGLSGIITEMSAKHFGQKALFLLSSFLATLVCGLMVFSYNLTTTKSIFTIFWFIWFLGFGITFGFCVLC